MNLLVLLEVADRLSLKTIWRSRATFSRRCCRAGFQAGSIKTAVPAPANTVVATSTTSCRSATARRHNGGDVAGKAAQPRC